MNAKKIKKNSLKIVAATSICLFSLVSAFSGAIAWFSANKDVANSGSQVGVKVLGKFKTISYHSYTGTPTSTNWSFNKTPYASVDYDWNLHRFNSPKDGSGNTISSFTFSMNQYDPMNQNKPILVLIELMNEYDASTGASVYVKGITETAGFLGAKEEGVSGVHLPKYKLDGTSPNLLLKSETVEGKTTDYYPLSSVVKFRSAHFSNSEYETWSGNSTYNLTTSNTYVPSDHNFTTVDHNNDTSSFEQSSLMYSSDGDDVVKYIAIVVDYNTDAIDYIYSTYLGDTVMEERYNYILNFLCDWKWEVA